LGRPSGEGHKIPNFFNFFVNSSEVALACLVERQVAMIKKSAIDDFLFKLTILIFSTFASSKMLKIISVKDVVLILPP